MTRDQAYQLLTKYLSNKNLVKHCLACEYAMRALSHKFQTSNPKSQEEEKWGITGLLHDADYELAQKDGDLHKHGLLLFEKETSIPADIKYAIQAHNPLTGVEPKSPMDLGDSLRRPAHRTDRCLHPRIAR